MNNYWHNINNKHGLVVEMLVESIDEELAFLIEMETIATYKSRGYILCNMTNGGDGCGGLVATTETRAKLSAINAGVNNNMYGRKGKDHPSYGYKHTEEHKKYMSELQKGKVLTEEHKAAMRKPKSEAGRLAIREAQEKLRASGYKPSEESNKRRSETLKGRPSPVKDKIYPVVSCSVCGKYVAVNMVNRWHEQNCKEATNECA